MELLRDYILLLQTLMCPLPEDPQKSLKRCITLHRVADVDEIAELEACICKYQSAAQTRENITLISK
jgi:hypothetical protein